MPVTVLCLRWSVQNLIVVSDHINSNYTPDLIEFERLFMRTQWYIIHKHIQMCTTGVVSFVTVLMEY